MWHTMCTKTLPRTYAFLTRVQTVSQGSRALASKPNPCVRSLTHLALQQKSPALLRPTYRSHSISCTASQKRGEGGSTSEDETDLKSRPKKLKKQPKKRLDEFCLEQYPQYSRQVIQSWIIQGKVLVNGHPKIKPGTSVGADAKIIINAEEPKYVCRAGFKMEKALEHFEIDVRGEVVMDAGVSTGGFTDCLLQNGAARVYGVDVGYGQVHEAVRQDERVTLVERTNVRYLEPDSLPEPVTLVTLDLSFISVLKVMGAVCNVMGPEGRLIVLIKPQFEAEKRQVRSGGVVRDPAVHQAVIDRVSAGIESHGFERQGCVESPIKGGTSGNTEFLAYFLRKGVSDHVAAPADDV